MRARRREPPGQALPGAGGGHVGVGEDWSEQAGLARQIGISGSLMSDIESGWRSATPAAGSPALAAGGTSTTPAPPTTRNSPAVPGLAGQRPDADHDRVAPLRHRWLRVRPPPCRPRTSLTGRPTRGRPRHRRGVARPTGRARATSRSTTPRRTSPSQAPTVTSSNYPQSGDWQQPGKPMQFTFDAKASATRGLRVRLVEPAAHRRSRRDR